MKEISVESVARNRMGCNQTQLGNSATMRLDLISHTLAQQRWLSVRCAFNKDPELSSIFKTTDFPFFFFFSQYYYFAINDILPSSL